MDGSLGDGWCAFGAPGIVQVNSGDMHRLSKGTAGKQGASTPRKKKDIFANAMSRAKGLNFSRSFALT